MPNTLKFIDMVAREAQSIAHESASFIKTTDMQYDDSFGVSGAKIGSTLRVRKPNKYVSTSGSAIQVQDNTEQTQTVTIATQRHVAMKFSSAELALDTNSPKEVAAFSKRYIEPATKQIISDIESEYIIASTKAVARTVGTAGTAMTDLVAVGAARAKLNQQLAPKDGNRYIMADSVTMGGMVNGLKGLFQDSTQIKEQYREGMIGRTAGADWYENERVWTMTNGTDVACTLDTYTVVEGDADLTVTGFATPTVGMVFTLAGSYDVHPETKQSYSSLKQFTILAGSTSTNLLISPAIYGPNSGALQNVSALPSTTAALTFVGLASTSYVQPIMYHKEAFQFVTAPLEALDTPDKFARRTQDNLSLSVWMQGDIRSYELICRIDILYGFAALRPEWACRMIGAAG